MRTALNAPVSWWRRHRREVALAGQDEQAAATRHPALDTALVAALRRWGSRR